MYCGAGEKSIFIGLSVKIDCALWLQMGLWSSSLHGYQMFLRKKEKKKRKLIKPPAVQKKTQSASGPHIKACCFNHHYSKIFLSSPLLSFLPRWNCSYLRKNSFHSHCSLNTNADMFFIQIIDWARFKRMLLGCWMGSRWRLQRLFTTNARMDKKKRGNPMWELNVVSDSKNSSKYLQWCHVHCLSFEYLLVFYLWLGFGLLIFSFIIIFLRCSKGQQVSALHIILINNRWRVEKYVLNKENIDDITCSDPPAAETIWVWLH